MNSVYPRQFPALLGHFKDVDRAKEILVESNKIVGQRFSAARVRISLQHQVSRNALSQRAQVIDGFSEMHDLG